MSVSITLEQWYFVVVSALKINDVQSRVCILFFDTWGCNIMNEIYVPLNTHTMRVGSGFVGIINKVKLF